MATFNKTLLAADESTNAAEERLDGTSFAAGQAVIRSGTSTANRSRAGILFENVTIPQGSTINSAIFRVSSQGGTGDFANTVVRAEDIDDAPNFTTNADLTSRTLTSAASASATQTNLSSTAYYNFPSIAAVIQEVVNRAGWTSGNSLLIVAVGGTNGTNLGCQIDRGADSFEPRIEIDYTEPAAAGSGGGGPQMQTAQRMLGVV